MGLPDRESLTPMMQQYLDVKMECMDCILFYRLGDFYEMFFDDAEICSRELEIALTGRDCGLEHRAPMCGVPYHACDGYIARLIEKGYKVAICEQMGDPKLAKGLVKREIIRTVTPGTVIESSMLDEKRNNYICSLYIGEASGACFCDISTGETYIAPLNGESIGEAAKAELSRFMPAEVVMNISAAALPEVTSFLKDRLGTDGSVLPDSFFDAVHGAEEISERFGFGDMEHAGLAGESGAAAALGALMTYLVETQKNDLSHVKKLTVCREGQYLELDMTVRRNLELTETMRGREKRGSLLWVLDKTSTAMGGRLIRRWVEKPLVDVAAILKRQAACRELMDDIAARDSLAEALRGILDLERLIGRVVYGTAGCRDLRAISEALKRVPAVKESISHCSSSLIRGLYASADPLEDISGLIDSAIVDEPPFSVREGGLIREGYDSDVDMLRRLVSGGKGMIGGIEAREKEKTGIKTLRVGYNRVSGYYIEVSKSYTSQVPAEYIRKQTLTNGERYITEELKQLEQQVLTAGDRLTSIEYQLFCDIRKKVAGNVDRIQNTAQAIAELDVLRSIADVGAKGGYVIPDVDDSSVVDIREGRHPVVEKMMKDALFVPNDTLLDCRENRMIIITGPNMAGKSTYMRQTALIVLMAQMGAPVPASYAHIGVCDKLFTRIGASDDLASGQSTFMVEMSEVADILKRATPRSLLIFDEIGRGTSTFDGMAIARAVLEYAADRKRLGAKTMFATHYHELTALEDTVDGVKNYNIAVKKRGDDIIFLRKIVRGGTDDSYGIEVAKLAGVPQRVIDQAKKILKGLEDGRETLKMPVRNREETDEPQISLGSVAAMELAEELKRIDVNVLTPIEGLNLLYKLKQSADKI